MLIVMRPKDTDPSFNVVHGLSDAQLKELHALYQNEWWSKGRTLDETRRCVSGSQICLGLVDPSATLAGFSRVLTDFTFKALIFDVIVAPKYRGTGLGDKLVSLTTSHERLLGVKSFELYCLPELVPFYERHSFSDKVGNIRLMRRAVA
jgi:GNAT superfamily N-acetyltransferase